MPVEIKELIIRAHIVSPSDRNIEPQSATSWEQKEAIIAACVAQVLKILERKKER